ncbi:hypothetical protein H6P81_009058 [Aristolochia fimbriata]|uniref:Uncharacterized protein n=1 Tax=Aristolochia fimbriata TaxID=158543 RepID=A0AAV7EJS7_ARIFI|nr:hypothetical protein H6P81_009058 [Aristolochia fimbriata]
MANIGRGGKSAHKGKAKSARKPLKDVSNTRKLTQSVGRISTDKDPALDRLVVVHSDLSNLIHQIDELVGQALKHQSTCKLRVQELESFADVLSNMHSTLKMWDIRFKQACSKSFTESSDRFVPEGVPVSTVQEKDQDDGSEKLDLDTLLSPSPLVSWRAGCRVDSGRQLFLLTPLPQTNTVPSKGLETMRHKPKRLPDVGLPPRTISLPPSSTSVSRFSEAVEGSEGEPAQKNFPKSATFKNVRTFGSTYDSPSRTSFQNIEKSVYLVDSLQKFSPLRTCVLLEPTSKHFQSSAIKVAANIHGCETEESPDLESAAYPDFLHLVTGNVRRNTIEPSLDWFLSPPKTCVVMEPPNEKTGSNGVIEEPQFILAKESTEHVFALDKDAGSIHQSSKHGISNAGPVHPECTPMWKDMGSTVRRGKRPGENTLKRELWTKFEAASTSRLEFNLSALQEPETKGFLDRLEEVLCEERD